MDTQDGFPVGVLESYMVGKTGIISGIYTNGMVRDLGQIALASFANPEGLTKASGNLYAVSANSGEAQHWRCREDSRVPLKHLRWKCPMLTCPMSLPK